MFERIRQWLKERKRCPRWRECKDFSQEKAVCNSGGSWTHVGTANHERCFSSRPSRQLNRVPSHQEMEIAKRNRERQQNTLGYGLKSRNFSPRPAFEKKLYDLTKKPAEDD